MINVTPMQFMCQKVLPLVYDDSLSYYEVLCKVSKKLNDTIENVNELNDTLTEFISYVNSYIGAYVSNYLSIALAEGTIKLNATYTANTEDISFVFVEGGE